jgi:tRNA (adenine22-N1)-methyltransferase
MKERENIIKLSPRLQAVADMVKTGHKLADIGTDHAYLPIYLVQEGRIPSAVAIDVHQGPYKSALQQVAAQGLKEKIKVLLGDGLEPLHFGQVDVAVLAGMGSTTMMDILNEKPEVTSSLKQLVLQPMVGIAQIRKWLMSF